MFHVLHVALADGVGQEPARAVARNAASNRPNIVFILADDSGFADYGCYGHPYSRTPNIDGLARDGTRFTQFYVTGITCCPSRTGFMTSQWPASFKTYPADGGFGDQVTITDLLHRAGYATGHFGKWHIGPEESAKAGTYGIDVVRSEHGRMKKDGMRGRDARIYDDAIRFIEQHREQPFYINVWSHISHYRIDPPESYVARFADLKVDPQLFAEPMRAKFAACRAAGGDIDLHMRRYLADIHSMDEDIGRLLDCLDNLGLRDNTIVVFSSDQGPAAIAEDADVSRRDAMGYTGIYRGGKHGMEEGGVRVPFLIRWPNQIPAGRVDSDSVISAIDWLPTLCQLCDVPIDAHAFEGEDVSLTWLGKQTHVREKPLLWKTSAVGSSAAIRDGKWKLFYPVRKRGELNLFDIEADPAEAHNVADQHPEITKRLAARAQAWVDTLPKDYIKTKDSD